MRQVIVRYKLKADRVEENTRLARDVFDELARTAPAGIAYGAFKLADGLNWVHIAFIAGDTNPLLALEAFKTYGARIADRCEESPVVADLTCVGTYGLPGVEIAAAHGGNGR